jgi:hypothetical protein
LIHKCALAVVGRRGDGVIGPSLSPIDADEEDFLHRHVDRLRAVVQQQDGRGRFRDHSFLAADLNHLLNAEDDDFLTIAGRMVSRLAAAMELTSNAKACVVAVLTEGPEAGAQTVSLLKLDAEVEAAEMKETPEGVRLHVYRDLLPRPGDIQKGFTWPDPRPASSIVVLDQVSAGSAVRYFQDAFEIDVSPRAKDTEDALSREIAALPAASAARALRAVGDGGTAEEVTTRITAEVPEFSPTARELGASGAMGGRVRPAYRQTAKKPYDADGIELRVPLSMLNRVVTRREGPGYVTTIRTETPLTPLEDGDVGGAT